MSDVTDALRALQRGERTIEDVEQMFRTRSWPKPQVTPGNARDAFARESNEDRDPDAPGSFAEVAHAFYTGVIDVDTYERLAEAVKASKGQQQEPPEGEEPPEDPPADPEGEEKPPEDTPPAGDGKDDEE